MVRLIFFIFLLLFAHDVINAQHSRIDSLRTVLRSAKDDTTRGSAYNSLSWEMARHDPDSAILLAQKALSIYMGLRENNPAVELAKKKGIAKSHQYLGWFYFRVGQFDKAVQENNVALELWAGTDDKRGLASTLGNQGIVYHNQGNYPLAQDFLLRALKMDEEIKNEEGIARDLTNLGLVYENNGEYPKALSFMLRSLELREKQGNRRAQALVLGNIALVEKENGDLYKALEYMLRAYNIANALDDKEELAILNQNIGGIYLLLGEEEEAKGNKAFADTACYRKSIQFFRQALELHRSMNEQASIPESLSNLGAANIHLGNYKEAEQYLIEAESLMDSAGTPDAKADLFENMSELYSRTNRPALALEYYRHCRTLRDSLYNIRRNNEMTRNEMNMEFERREETLKAAQEKQNAVAEERESKQRMIITVISIGFILVLIFAIIALRAFRQKQRANGLLEEKNKLIAQQKERIEMKQKEILDSIYYAKRIQESHLPSGKYIDNAISRLKEKN